MSTGKIELSVGAVKYVDTNEMITEEEYNYIKNKTPELDERVGVIEDEMEQLDNKAYKTYVTYKEFGAKLNGVDDDTQYIKECHVYANNNGLKVVQQNSLIVLSEEIEVKTDLDLTGSTVISKLKDNDVPYNRTKSLYKITGKPLIAVDVSGTLTKGSRELNITKNGYVAIMGSEIYMKRFNLNVESNVLNWESNYVNNGKLSYPLINDHTTNYTLYIREDDIPLTIKGCKFITEYETSKALSLFRIERNNVTIDNVQLSTVGEGTISPLYTIANVSRCCNTILNNIQCDKMSNADGKGLSYFMLLEMCNNIHLSHLKQGRIGWSGINGNFIRDIKADNCYLLKYGCHALGWDMSLKNSTLYNGISIHGGGELNLDNCILYDVGLENKLDYAGEFRGVWNIKNCKAYNMRRLIYLAACSHDHKIVSTMPDINIENLYFETNEDNSSIVYYGYLDKMQYKQYMSKKIYIKNCEVYTYKRHNTILFNYPLSMSLTQHMDINVDGLNVYKESYLTDSKVWDASNANFITPKIEQDELKVIYNIKNSICNIGIKDTKNITFNIENCSTTMVRILDGVSTTNGNMFLNFYNCKFNRPYANIPEDVKITVVNSVFNMRVKDDGTKDTTIANGFSSNIIYASNNISEYGGNVTGKNKLYNYIDTNYYINS